MAPTLIKHQGEKRRSPPTRRTTEVVKTVDNCLRLAAPRSGVGLMSHQAADACPDATGGRRESE
jgi:hypothetical protein